MLADQWDKVKEVYGPKLQKLAEDIKEYLTQEGLVVNEPFELEDDDSYKWYLTVKTNDHKLDESPTDGDIDITFGFVSDCDEENPILHINFMTDVIEYGGRIIGGFAPFNYTDKVWVDTSDEEALAERWNIFKDGCDGDDLIELLRRQ